jgi:hypothetical protein
MHIDHLKKSLKTLHAQLETTGQVDGELRELLRVLDGDIQQLLEKEPADEALSHTYGLAERTQELTAEFAAKHPQLEPALRELGTILASMGI